MPRAGSSSEDQVRLEGGQAEIKASDGQGQRRTDQLRVRKWQSVPGRPADRLYQRRVFLAGCVPSATDGSTLFEPSVGWNVWEKRCVTRRVLLAEVAPSWLLEHMDPEWAERYQKRFSDFRLPKDAKERVALAETIGAEGRRLLERVYAESSLPWLGDLDAIETLRRVWIQHSHASEQGTRFPY